MCLVRLFSCRVALRPVVVITARFRSGVPRHLRSLWPQGSIPQALTLIGRVRLIAWCMRRPSLGECQRGPGYFSKCRARVGCGPAPGPTLKRPCAIIIRLVGQKTNTVTKYPILAILRCIIDFALT